jgi:hypothetical protein
MGGMHSTVVDYAKWVVHLLSAWPPRDERDSGPVGRATVRERAVGSGFPDRASYRSFTRRECSHQPCSDSAGRPYRTTISAPGTHMGQARALLQ